MDRMVVPSPVAPALSYQEGTGSKPAMAGQRYAFPTTPAATESGQGLRPVDPKPRPKPSVLGIKLTVDLRDRIAQAAQVSGISDSAWLRARALEALGMESAVDAASGRRLRIPPEDQAALAACIRDLGEATLAARAGRQDDAVAAMEKARRVLIPVVLGFERRA